jgi:hypothetical protein
MTPRARWATLAVLALVLGGIIWAAGQRDQAPITGGQRLGPEAGEPVAGYLTRAAASLPAGDSPRWALVQLDSYLTPESAAELVRGVRLAKVVLRVPMPRVQTALITRDLPGQRSAAELTAALRSASADRLAASRSAPAGRREAIAAAEATRLREGCACVLALLVFGDPGALRTIAARPGIRVVDAAIPDTPIQELAISPLLPEQIEVVGPVPDDGPVSP